jgi:hypothetical protein
MPVFPSTSSNGLPRRTDSLNATQQKPASHAVFGAVEEELHDAKRVEKHGQEDDLRYALGMVIRRVEELVSLFLVCFLLTLLHENSSYFSAIS